MPFTTKDCTYVHQPEPNVNPGKVSGGRTLKVPPDSRHLVPLIKPTSRPCSIHANLYLLLPLYLSLTFQVNKSAMSELASDLPSGCFA
jgi:hypothetical protein